MRKGRLFTPQFMAGLAEWSGVTAGHDSGLWPEGAAVVSPNGVWWKDSKPADGLYSDLGKVRVYADPLDRKFRK